MADAPTTPRPGLARRVHALLPALLLAGSLVAVGCRTAPINAVAVSLPTTSEVSLDVLSNAVVGAGADLGWLIEVIEPGKAVGTLRLRQHVAVVNIGYGPEGLRIDYVRSENLLHKGDRIHRKYNTWVKNLRERIQQRVAAL